MTPDLTKQGKQPTPVLNSVSDPTAIGNIQEKAYEHAMKVLYNIGEIPTQEIRRQQYNEAIYNNDKATEFVGLSTGNIDVNAYKTRSDNINNEFATRPDSSIINQYTSEQDTFNTIDRNPQAGVNMALSKDDIIIPDLVTRHKDSLVYINKKLQSDWALDLAKRSGGNYALEKGALWTAKKFGAKVLGPAGQFIGTVYDYTRLGGNLIHQKQREYYSKFLDIVSDVNADYKGVMDRLQKEIVDPIVKDVPQEYWGDIIDGMTSGPSVFADAGPYIDVGVTGLKKSLTGGTALPSLQNTKAAARSVVRSRKVGVDTEIVDKLKKMSQANVDDVEVSDIIKADIASKAPDGEAKEVTDMYGELEARRYNTGSLVTINNSKRQVVAVNNALPVVRGGIDSRSILVPGSITGRGDITIQLPPRSTRALTYLPDVEDYFGRTMERSDTDWQHRRLEYTDDNGGRGYDFENAHLQAINYNDSLNNFQGKVVVSAAAPTTFRHPDLKGEFRGTNEGSSMYGPGLYSSEHSTWGNIASMNHYLKAVNSSKMDIAEIVGFKDPVKFLEEYDNILNKIGEAGSFVDLDYVRTNNNTLAIAPRYYENLKDLKKANDKMLKAIDHRLKTGLISKDQRTLDVVEALTKSNEYVDTVMNELKKKNSMGVLNSWTMDDPELHKDRWINQTGGQSVYNSQNTPKLNSRLKQFMQSLKNRLNNPKNVDEYEKVLRNARSPLNWDIEYIEDISDLYPEVTMRTTLIDIVKDSEEYKELTSKYTPEEFRKYLFHDYAPDSKDIAKFEEIVSMLKLESDDINFRAAVVDDEHALDVVREELNKAGIYGSKHSDTNYVVYSDKPRFARDVFKQEWVQGDKLFQKMFDSTAYVDYDSNIGNFVVKYHHLVPTNKPGRNPVLVKKIPLNKIYGEKNGKNK